MLFFALFFTCYCVFFGGRLFARPQVKKALIASGVSLLFTFIVTVLAFTKMEDMKNGTAKYLIPVSLRPPPPPRPWCRCYLRLTSTDSLFLENALPSQRSELP